MKKEDRWNGKTEGNIEGAAGMINERRGPFGLLFFIFVLLWGAAAPQTLGDPAPQTSRVGGLPPPHPPAGWGGGGSNTIKPQTTNMYLYIWDIFSFNCV